MLLQPAKWASSASAGPSNGSGSSNQHSQIWVGHVPSRLLYDAEQAVRLQAADAPDLDDESRNAASAHFRQLGLEACSGVLVLTEKNLPQGRLRGLIVGCLVLTQILSPSQFGQRSPSDCG